MRAIPSRSNSRCNKVKARRRTLCLVTFSNIFVANSNPETQILYFHQLVVQNWQRAKHVAATVCVCETFAENC
ncbi:hypothetical protein Y032_0051g2127 [Ancylostoma ceylanicum]|uniref:Uncharacterized protein n=1 Tax=Ancylostoma ceylanicum TaxID=53326 RepID=A0A016U7I9_9BILA|nr:hypothetical protein Y032_0051g2127 [Ancylostoma ceylanicum]